MWNGFQESYKPICQSLDHLSRLRTLTIGQPGLFHSKHDLLVWNLATKIMAVHELLRVRGPGGLLDTLDRMVLEGEKYEVKRPEKHN